jgi:uncharacterized protein (TIGR00297 family)
MSGPEILNSVLARAVGGFLIAGVVVFFAVRRNALSASGAVLALVTGTICAAAGWSWAALLIAFFVSANVLSHYRSTLRAERIDGIIEKGSTRDAWQVAANGGVFTLAAVGSLIHPSPVWAAAGAGAIAAVTADTWSTEIGTVADQLPRLITTGRIVPPGTSGAVTIQGLVAAFGGSIFVAAIVWAAGWGVLAAVSALAGGLVGSIVDSFVGATLQRTRWCSSCEKVTERLVHSCGTMTQPRAGVPWIGNDAVNVIAALAGALAGIAAAR